MGGEFTCQPKWGPIGFDPRPSCCALLLSDCASSARKGVGSSSQASLEMASLADCSSGAVFDSCDVQRNGMAALAEGLARPVTCSIRKIIRSLNRQISFARAVVSRIQILFYHGDVWCTRHQV